VTAKGAGGSPRRTLRCRRRSDGGGGGGASGARRRRLRAVAHSHRGLDFARRAAAYSARVVRRKEGVHVHRSVWMSSRRSHARLTNGRVFWRKRERTPSYLPAPPSLEPRPARGPSIGREGDGPRSGVEAVRARDCTRASPVSSISHPALTRAVGRRAPWVLVDLPIDLQGHRCRVDRSRFEARRFFGSMLSRDSWLGHGRA
jgi:hypothetical protein